MWAIMWFEHLLDFIDWCKIVLSPTLLAGLAGVCIYILHPDLVGLFAAITMVILGLVVGIIWANRMWKIYSTCNMNRIRKIRSEYIARTKELKAGNQSNNR
jgi:hypothetical protein